MITLHEGDSRKVLADMKARGVKVQGVVCDPPYGLVSTVKRFGKPDASPAKHGTDGAYARMSRGFMGAVWDGTQIERDPEFWKQVYDVMLPGAYIVAFSSSRTYHHMAVAIEAAGFVTHPMIGWTFASGMPKAHDAAKAVDKELGVTREVLGTRDVGPDFTGDNFNRADGLRRIGEITEATSDEAKTWNGYFYGGQARKPALEPIYVGQKPFSEKNGAQNILKHGVGAVNIDGLRISTDELIMNHSRSAEAAISKGKFGDSKAQQTHQTMGQQLGRWPANLIHDGSPEVIALFPESKGACAPVKGTEPSSPTKNIYGKFAGRVPQQLYGDQSGSAARFFESYTFLCAECEDLGYLVEWDQYPVSGYQIACPSCCGDCNAPSPFADKPVFHVPKANKRDRAGSDHPTVKPIPLINALIRHIMPPQGGTVLDPFAGSGTTGAAALMSSYSAILIEQEPQFAEDIRSRLGMREEFWKTVIQTLDFDSKSTDSGLPNTLDL